MDFYRKLAQCASECMSRGTDSICLGHFSGGTNQETIQIGTIIWIFEITVGHDNINNNSLVNMEKRIKQSMLKYGLLIRYPFRADFFKGFRLVHSGTHFSKQHLWIKIFCTQVERNVNITMENISEKNEWVIKQINLNTNSKIPQSNCWRWVIAKRCWC